MASDQTAAIFTSMLNQKRRIMRRFLSFLGFGRFFMEKRKLSTIQSATSHQRHRSGPAGDESGTSVSAPYLLLAIDRQKLKLSLWT